MSISFLSARRSARVIAAAVAVALVAGGAALGAAPAVATPITTNGNGNATDVGAWFVTYNNTATFADNFNHGFPVQYRPLDQNGNYSIPDSSDPALMDFYLGKLASAGIDFIIFDETNGGLPGTTYAPENASIVQNEIMAMQRIKIWNDAHAWKIKYTFAIGTFHNGPNQDICRADSAGLCAENQAASILSNFVNNSSYGGPNYYYYVNGAPLLILYDFNSADPLADWNAYSGSKTAGSQFTMRGANASTSGQYGWQTSTGTHVNPEVEVVSPGWQNHNGNTPIPRNNGDYYQQSWNTVLNNPHPRMVVIASFNDYNEDTAIWTADTTNVDPAHDEKWTGHDGALHPSMYWDATVSNIAALKTTNPQVNIAAGATTSSSSVYAPWPTSNLTDANWNSAFSSATGLKTNHTEWAQVNFGSVKTFDHVTLASRRDASYGFPKDFQIQVWDGTNWVTRVQQTNFPTPAPGEAVTFKWDQPDNTDRVRVLATSLGTDNTGDYLLQLSELEVLAPNTAFAGTGSASSVYAPWPASNLTDGNWNTALSTAVGQKSNHTEWAQVNFGSVKTFDRITLGSRRDASYGFPKDFQIQVWNGTAWITRVQQTNFPTPVPGQAVTFKWDQPDNTDRVRVLATSLGTDNSADYLLQLTEIEVQNY